MDDRTIVELRGELTRATDQAERLRKLARELSDALIRVRPLGGSELFRRVGDEFYADPSYCGAMIDKLRADLHEARKDAVRAEREAFAWKATAQQ